ncbi:MAG: hypothetical protein JO068_07765, partial [Hyphomicrobiales bacterium]|nr:hypothetical protein [Hyphomicrobiales bacterium]
MTASAQRAAEPSMEEILASIRRIIADDKSRARIGSAKLVSVSDSMGEKPMSEPARQSSPAEGAPQQTPVVEPEAFTDKSEVAPMEVSALDEAAPFPSAESAVSPEVSPLAEAPPLNEAGPLAEAGPLPEAEPLQEA